MKKLTTVVILLVLSISFCFGASAAGFTSNADEIEKAADSVLLLAGPNASDPDIVSQGSGFVAFNSSTLVTNYHVIGEVSSLFAWDDEDDEFTNGYEIKYILCADKEADIAILEFAEPTRLKPLDLYADDGLKRGSPVLAIGSPGGGAKNTVSAGIISSQYINSNGVPEIQTTAAISHGSSGGALFNDDGKVIGVTTATSALEDTQNINFAINIAVAQAMYNAWDGTRYTFENHKNTAKMDFTGVYDHSDQPAISGLTEPFEPVIESGNNSSESWTCLYCGHENTSKFCQECGAEKPYWVCSCGRVNSSKFCGDCGKSMAEQIEFFNSAMDDVSRHLYSEAIAVLVSLSSFDSGSFETAAGTHAVAKSLIPKLYYDQGIYLQENNGVHEEIIASFEKAGDYADAKAQIQGENARYLKAFYDAGVEYLNNGEYEAAVQAFRNAGDYQDSKERIKEVYYRQGSNLLAKKEYDKAFTAFTNAADYSDAEERIKEVFYLQGVDAYLAGNYEVARELFEKTDGFRDAKSKIDEINENEKEKEYQLGLTAYNEGDYALALEHFGNLSGYRDTDDIIENLRINSLHHPLLSGTPLI